VSGVKSGNVPDTLSGVPLSLTHCGTGRRFWSFGFPLVGVELRVSV
jgi:hypothetical protein